MLPEGWSEMKTLEVEKSKQKHTQEEMKLFLVKGNGFSNLSPQPLVPSLRRCEHFGAGWGGGRNTTNSIEDTEARIHLHC